MPEVDTKVASGSTHGSVPLPADDPKRRLTNCKTERRSELAAHWVSGRHVYDPFVRQRHQRTVLSMDFHVPPCGGPGPHRHDFEESFTLLEGEIEVTFREEKSMVRVGETVHIPANPPHFFQNVSEQPVRLLCICSPAGQEEFFLEVGVPVGSRTELPPKLDEAGRAAFIAKAVALAPKYRSEILKPE